MKNELENEKELEKETEDKSLSSFLFTTLKIFTALVALVGMIYLSGLREYLFFRETSSNIELNSLEKNKKWEEIEVPFQVILIRESVLGTNRNGEQIDSLLDNAQSILNQAGILLNKEKVLERELPKEKASELLDGNFSILEDDLSENQINIILVKTLGGINGIAYPSKKVVMIPDYTAGYDFRTLAHEVGHVLGLGHIENHKQVMTQGKSGLLFSEEEIIKMRKIINEEF